MLAGVSGVGLKDFSVRGLNEDERGYIVKFSKSTIIEIVIAAIILAIYQTLYGRPSVWVIMGVFVGVGLVVEIVKSLIAKKRLSSEKQDL
jgi:predicted membrane channel-forming protein YqfA (hemolysin III family)